MSGWKQICRSSHTHSKRVASQLKLRSWSNDTTSPRSSPPTFDGWAEEFLAKVPHPNTKKRYSSSVGNLRKVFGAIRLKFGPAGYLIPLHKRGDIYASQTGWNLYTSKR